MGNVGSARLADEDTNPIDWSVSAGVGGRGIIPGRDDDVFGIGYYYYHLNLDRLTGVGVIDDYTHGAEAFYNIALTPAAFLTLSGQVIEDAFPGTDTAVLLGARLHLRF
jgi:porin